jgi:hypothetical protein
MIKIAEFLQSLMRLLHHWLSAAHLRKSKLVFVILFFVSYIIYRRNSLFVSESDMSESDMSESDMSESYMSESYMSESLTERVERKQGDNSDFMKVADSQSNVESRDDLFFSPITAKMARSIQQIRVSGFNFCSILDHSLFNPWVHICILYILNDSRA